MDRVYLDYNIYTRLADGKLIMPKNYLRYAKIYISVAHAEEFYNAKDHDIGGKNKSQLDKIECLLTRELNSEGILKPKALNNSSHIVKIENTSDDIYHSMYRSKSFDTRESIREIAGDNYAQWKECRKELYQNDKNAVNNSTLSFDEIWSRQEVVNHIASINERYKLTDYGNKNIISSLTKDYGAAKAQILYKLYRLQPFEIKKGMYKEACPNFIELEQD